MHLSIAGVLAFAASSCGQTGVHAAREDNPSLTDQSVVSLDDQKFLTGAEKAGIRQLTLAQEALRLSKNADVRKFAEQVIKNRSDALSELKGLMDSKHMQQPATLAEEIQLEARTRLAGASGDAFDHEFISLMTIEQQDTVTRFESAAETSADPDIRAYAGRIAPSLRADYVKALDLEQKMAVKASR
jgi:putative membrane protein